MTDRRNARLVYSTSTDGKCPVCGMEKTGRGGKTVTVVYGLPQNAEFLKELAQELKRACGTGGTTTEDGVELQGDLRDRVREVLAKRGYVVKG
jgi:translation initiation factor 1